MFERRRFNRYRPVENTFFVFGYNSNLMGKINDISVNGIGYKYTPIVGNVSEPNLIDITGTLRNRFYILGIQCRKIHNTTLLSEHDTFRTVRITCSGVQFVNLTGEQSTRLEVILQYFDSCFN